jgi:arabinan endo-1,5-alpha-L-arabinosidase
MAFERSVALGTRPTPFLKLRRPWITNVATGNRGYFWAPDVIFRDGRYWIYYSVSRFGVNTRRLVSRPIQRSIRLSRISWSDHGIVVQTVRSNNFNAIDPQVIKTGG